MGDSREHSGKGTRKKHMQNIQKNMQNINCLSDLEYRPRIWIFGRYSILMFIVSVETMKSRPLFLLAPEQSKQNDKEKCRTRKSLPTEGRLAFPPWSLSNWLLGLRDLAAYWSWLRWLTSQNPRNEVRILGVFTFGRFGSRGLRAFVEKTCRRVSVEFGGRRERVWDQFCNPRVSLYIGFPELNQWWGLKP